MCFGNKEILLQPTSKFVITSHELNFYVKAFIIIQKPKYPALVIIANRFKHNSGDLLQAVLFCEGFTESQHGFQSLCK